jgi:hypothetical protein
MLIIPYGPKGVSYAVAAKTVSNDFPTFCVLKKLPKLKK